MTCDDTYDPAVYVNVETKEIVPIPAEFLTEIPVDGTTIQYNSDGQLEAVSSGGGSDSDILTLNSWYTSSDWTPVAAKIKEAIDDNYNQSLLPSLVVSKGNVFNLVNTGDFTNNGNGYVTVGYHYDGFAPTNTQTNSSVGLSVGGGFVFFRVSKTTGEIDGFYRPSLSSGTVLTSSMVDTGLQYSGGFLSVNTGTIATKTYVDNAVAGGSGGSNEYVITVSATYPQMGDTDKTFAEVEAAYVAGKTLILKYIDSTNGIEITGDLSSVAGDSTNGYTAFWFNDTYNPGTGALRSMFFVNENAINQMAQVSRTELQNIASSLTLTSPNGTHYTITVDNNGNLSAVAA